MANFCFLTKDTNLHISDRLPEEYFREVEEKHPGALASQWVPMDAGLWKVDRYLDFLEERKKLLATAANAFLTGLLHERVEEPEVPEAPEAEAAPAVAAVPGGIESQDEEERLIALNQWMVEQNLPEGNLLHELASAETGEPEAILDLAWPDGLQEGLSQPVAVLLNEPPETLEVTNAAGLDTDELVNSQSLFAVAWTRTPGMGSPSFVRTRPVISPSPVEYSGTGMAARAARRLSKLPVGALTALTGVESAGISAA